MTDEPLLEREAEQARLRKLVEQTAHGGTMVVLEGAAGIGKTRLIRQAREAGRHAGLRVLHARGMELEQSFSFGVVRQLFEPCLFGPQVERADWWKGSASAASPVFQVADQSETSAGEFAVLHGLYWLMVNIASEKPLLLLVDDLHSCDTASLQWLAYILPRIEGVPLSIVATLRPGSRGNDQALLALITGDPATEVLAVAPLTESATAQLLHEIVGQPVDLPFADACHAYTGGNPMLVRAVGSTIKSQEWTPSAENSARLFDIQGQAITAIVNRQLAMMSKDAIALARAVAVLGESADLSHAATIAGLEYGVAARSAAALAEIEVLQQGIPLTFAHPVVQAAVLAQIDLADRQAAHATAANLLAAEGADPERIAAHLLNTAHAGNPDTVRRLRTAAAAATRRGFPVGAHNYLRRALTEPASDDQRLSILCDLASTAQEVNLVDAANYLTEAMELSDSPPQRAMLALGLGLVLIFLERDREAVSTIESAIDALPPEDDDIRRRLEALLIDIPYLYEGWENLHDRVSSLRDLPAADTLGARMLDGMIAMTEVFGGDPQGITRAEAALADGRLTFDTASQFTGHATATALLFGQPSEGVDVLDVAIRSARTHGSATSLSSLHMYRSWGWLLQGQLAESEADAREALGLMDATHARSVRPAAVLSLARVLVAQGALSEAGDLVEGLQSSVPQAFAAGIRLWYQDTYAQLLRARGLHSEALDHALAAGQTALALGIKNPAFMAWRSEAALCLHAVGRTGDAQDYAAEELELARRFGAPHGLGRALRVAGLVQPTRTESVSLLTQAVSVLRGSYARLEYAKALVDLGRVHRRAGQRAQAKPLLQAGADEAETCGARPVVETAFNELRILGARPRRIRITGIDALTPSERRVAGLAATGMSNREIAQDLFVTPKTVEVHLSAVYRKLDIASRHKLASVLGS